MNIKNITNRIPIGLLCLTVLFAIFSWVGNIYEIGVRNLFSDDGIRWVVINFIPNICNSPFAYVIVSLISLSVLKESRLRYSFSHKASLKQKRALSLAILVFMIACIISVFMLFMPNAVLLNSFGTISNSPFTRGLFGLICLVIIIISNVYGLTSGSFINLNDTLKAHTALLKQCQTYFITMIIVSELIGCIKYSDLLSVDNPWFNIITWCLYIIPLAISFLDEKK